MTPQVPRGLGDISKTQLRLVRETVELPASRKELVQRFETILSTGGVQRVLVQLGRPIEVDRFVPAAEELTGIEEVPIDDLLDRVRNGDLRTLGVDEKIGALPALFFAFQELAAAEVSPVALYVTNKKCLKKWLALDKAQLDKVFGVEVRESKEIPEDAAILIGVQDDLTVGVRIPVPEFQKATTVTMRQAKPGKVLK